ncbi:MULTISPECIES: transcriptional regulator GcvA [unclassified Photobacterium]|uniref:transcriptional regulator GcvA n=1 Tax=unclassified Photobacterium TaxID=2628852 RepID=UPI001EDCC4EC|nr:MULTISPECIES: transcriptional regulator GcvA [unclassified Photobacterium]MCG3865485.1 transcriptional regulator GcvA [Photobacterium sp. Ph6]MCG3876982.1 transcriptional regulator GcvA [Photobacterium sp. Ph5]
MKLPIHLNALKAFEVSARHQSFSAAAEELNVTPAAVGQLVRTLEEWLETPLFHRANSGKIRLLPTETAERALPEIRAGFDKLSQGLELLQQSPASGILTVTVSPAFAAKWLLPRLDRFQALCPESDVRLDTNLKPIDFVIQRVDIGVRYGAGNWQGLVAEKLMEEEVFPVCSPQLLAKADSLIKPRQLLQQTFIHDLSMDEDSGFPTWSAWLNKAGINHQPTHNIQINNSAAVLQTAIDGSGIALARSVMVKDDLAAGRLVRLFPEIQFESPLAYFVVYKPESIDIAKVQVFRDWLHQEVKG